MRAISIVGVIGLVLAGHPALAQPVPESVEPAISSIEVTGNTVVAEPDIRAAITEKVGDAFKPDRYQRDADAVEALYTKAGYQAVVESFAMATDGVVRFRILESTVDSLEVRGNHKTRRDTVLKMVGTRPGLLYRRDRAQTDVKDLYNLGIFDDVTYRLEPGSAPGRLKVVYTVDEAKTGEVAAGFSYSGSSGIIGQLEVIERNFGGRAEAVGAFVQSGGKFYRSGFQLQFHNPFLDARHTSLDFGAYAKSVYRFSGSSFLNSQFDIGQGYDEFRTGADVSFSRSIGRNLTGGVGFRGNGVKAHYSYAIPDLGFSEGRNPGIRDGSVFAVSGAIASDRRDYGLDPARGDIQVLTVEAGRTRLDEQDFTTGSDGEGSPTVIHTASESDNLGRASLDWRHYVSRGRSDKRPTRRVPVLAARLVAGTLTDKAPFWEQYFVGGIGIGGVRYSRFLTAANSYEDPFGTTAQALRGYSEGRFWGRNMLVGSIEYRFPVAESTRLALFVDAGDAWGNEVKALDPYEIDPEQQDRSFIAHASIGAGLRVATPVGPIRVDFGVGSEGSRTHFSIGQVF